MKYEGIKLFELVDTISDTRKIDKDKVVLVNTSDVLAGAVLNHTYSDNCNLRGQFKKRFKKDDILYSEIRPTNKRFAYIDFDSEDYIASTKLMVLRRKSDKITNKFLYYCLTNDLFIERMQHLAEARSGTFPQITFDVLKNETIYLPSVDNQNKITSVLDNINNKIELNNEINNNLYELIKNNYEALISNCDWEEVELGTIANITSGKRPIDKTEKRDYPVIGANGVMAYTNDFNFDEDLIITGRVGTLGVVKRYAEKIWASDNTLVIQTKYLNYIENYMKTIDYYSLNRGSTQPLLTQGDLKKQLIIFNEEAILRFEKENEIFIDKIRNNEKENENLKQLRDTLLPKLMSGEIDLDSIEI